MDRVLQNCGGRSRSEVLIAAGLDEGQRGYHAKIDQTAKATVRRVKCCEIVEIEAVTVVLECEAARNEGMKSWGNVSLS
jgi:hypothetical protein